MFFGNLKYLFYSGDRSVWNGGRDIAEYNASGQLQAEYVHGDYIDEVLAMSRAGKNYYYHYDGLGSVSDLTDDQGNVVERYTYDVYGQPSRLSSVGNPFLFTGRRFDDESGLYYYRLRMYSPTIGRFLQRDPIGYYDSMNLFEYCFNNPVNWVDPWGLSGYWDEFWGGLGGSFNQAAGAAANFWGNAFKGGVEWGATPGSFADQAGQFGGCAAKRGVQGLSGIAIGATAVAASLIGYEALTGMRIEFHTPHLRGPHQYPHLQGIQGPGWGKTLWRWPTEHPWWWPKSGNSTDWSFFWRLWDWQ